jgi:uncharacterized protein YjbI with pentapeptide repeats
LREANLTDADLVDSYLARTDLTDANLTNAIFFRAELSSANLVGALMRGTVMPDGKVQDYD